MTQQSNAYKIISVICLFICYVSCILVVLRIFCPIFRLHGNVDESVLRPMDAVLA